MDAIKNYKLHILTLVIVIVSEFIGIRKLGILVLMPILYATIFGGFISAPKFKVLKMDDMKQASSIFPIALMILLAKVGLGVGPQLQSIMAAKGTMFIQMFAHFLGTVVMGLPVAMLLGLRRESVGATYSLGREAQVAIIADRFGLDSEEGRGVMGVFIVGTVLGALWTSVFASIITSLNIFHPYALALGAGTGSMSMSTAALEVITANFPQAEFAQKISAYMNTSNLLTNVIGVYANMFLTLPLTIFLYNTFNKFRKNKQDKIAA
jgi:hypothetical protein